MGIRLGLASLVAVSLSCTANVSAEQVLQVEELPLTDAARILGSQAGISIVLERSVDGSVRTHRVTGASNVDQAVSDMLEGSGLSWAQVAPGLIEIRGSKFDEADGRAFSAIRVEGAESSGSAFADVNGFGLGAGVNGSSDVTATEGSGSLTSNNASIASKTGASLKNTPQTVSVVTSEEFKQQNMADVSDALAAAPGVTLAMTSKGRPAFLSRGFEISSYQVDGGAPMRFPSSFALLSTPDLSAYDHIEVLRGSSALFAGVGDPGGVVNLQRKRPVDGQQVIIDGSAGSWDSRRLQVDASSPLAFDGRLRGRMVVSQENNDLFYDEANREQGSLYGILEADLSDDTLLRFGVRYQRVRDDSPNVLGVPRYGNGDDLKLSRSTNFSAPWAYTDENQREKFIQLESRLSDTWTAKLDYSSTHSRSTSLYPSFYGLINPDRSGYFRQDDIGQLYEQRQHSLGASLTGKFNGWGREHSLVLGADYSKDRTTNVEDNYFVDSIAVDPSTYDPDSTGPFSGGDPYYSQTQGTLTRQVGLYGNLSLELLEGLHLSAGVREARVRNSSDAGFSINGLYLGGFNFEQQSDNNYTKSVGLLYEINETYSTYINYSDIISANTLFVGATGTPLDPERGKTVEIGLKAAFAEDALNLSLAYFKTHKTDVPVYSGTAQFRACCYLPDGEVESEGVDVQLSGALTPRWQVTAGYTYTDLRRNQALERSFFGIQAPYAQSQTPRHQFKLWTAYALSGGLEGFTVGGGVRVESERSTEGSDCADSDPLTGQCVSPGVTYAYTQPLYAVTDLRLGYTLNKHWDLAANVTNLFDRRYYATAGQLGSGNFYGEPRKLMFSVRAQF
ncbi:TonB-dependent siderophore receptor [Pseudomonas sp. NPDC012596]|uniref:TonB-dependent siderophore receptor n=1 Tax=Pseudomonas sp. NPDC012596 TaxID=3364419 RepID=UPI003682BD81